MNLYINDFQEIDIEKNSHLRFLFFHNFPEKMNFFYNFPVGGTESWVVFSDKGQFENIVDFSKQIIALPHLKYDHYTLSTLAKHLPISFEEVDPGKLDGLVEYFSDIYKSFSRAEFLSIKFDFSGQKEGVLIKFKTSSFCLVISDEERYYGFWGP
jgi:hypothetical protein